IFLYVSEDSTIGKCSSQEWVVYREGHRELLLREGFLQDDTMSQQQPRGNANAHSEHVPLAAGRLELPHLAGEADAHAQANVHTHPLYGFVTLQILHAGGEQELGILIERVGAMPVHEATVHGVCAHVDADWHVSPLIGHQRAEQLAWP